MAEPIGGDGDLTAKARVRNAALELFGEQGEQRVSLRKVASHAGVTLGLVQHHYKTKDGLREAVEQLVVDYFARAIASVPDDCADAPRDGARGAHVRRGGPVASAGTGARVAAARDDAVRAMLRDNPLIVDYVRRDALDPASGGGLLRRLTELTAREVAHARSAGLASTQRPESAQVVAVMVRQLGELLLAPMVQVMWEQLGERDETRKPTVRVAVEDRSGDWT
ncbi:helix-turn-helix domain-containing protein [Tomitella cavernea]|uniref:TetR/AcrR family transcriptional regulator n=1 Tax=Tomitella cavernea TaxID=1387982 RepID=A0ABP9CUX5_9ACTN|nr:helix-turn-helix domain-containing protein [Tomitella cavernea]